jgi:pimeloyl-ACP methyl ester carboxylesterase
MNFNIIKNVIIVFLFLCFTTVSGQHTILRDTTSFFPNWERVNEDNIDWKYLLVPENWEDPTSNKIKIAVGIIKNLSNVVDPNAVVFIQGGPGASGIDNIRSWLWHPLRETNDIVLFDIRGTGYSEPRLCPDLGKEFFEILAKNQLKEEDEKQKTDATLSCKRDLLSRGIDIDAYHSMSVSKDLHALKNQLGYPNWNVYGASYGTYVAQVYANEYPEDIKALLLDSSILDITTYYTQNTSNYMNSLAAVFKKCENDLECNNRYPDLENIYYKIIADLKENPITVSVDESIIETGEFTYNVEDFKIAVQQVLYNKKLIEIIPLLIYQFQDRNEKALGNLVASFSSLLSMDYGVYYCISCNEVLPNNELAEYQKDASQYENLKGGVSFYKSDFKVCDEWNLNRKDSIIHYDLSKLYNLSSPVLVFSGEYDPIIPVSNGKKIAEKFKNANSIIGSGYGHVPGFTEIGNQITKEFVNNPNQKPNLNAFKSNNKIHFVEGVTINPGISKVGNSLNRFNLIFLAPLLVALGIMLVFVFTHLIKLLRKKYSANSDYVIRILSVLTSVIGITGLIALVLALMKVSNQNLFILAFGLPDNFNYVFMILSVFAVFLSLTLLYFFIRIRKINDRSILFVVLFSNILVTTYLFYWGIF